MHPKRIIAPGLLAVLFGALLIQLPLAIAERTSIYEWYNTIQDVRHVLVESFVREPDEEAMQQAMIDAMIETLDDPYTLYVPPEDTDDFNKQLRGTYAGIGAEVNVADGYLVIVTPMDDSPALRAGVMAGDIVLQIEGNSTHQVPINECIEMLAGEVGTEVTIRARHLDGVEEDITIVRGFIVTRTVKGLRRHGEEWNYCVDDELGLAYARITQFNADTVAELAEALGELHATGLNGLILDLRDDPGGELPAAVGVADLFLEQGTIAHVRPRHGEQASFSARAEGTLPYFPMVVIVNGRSASASEIVAGALQENGRAKVLGTRTFGKGSVQEVRALPYSRGTLKFTTAYYYLPGGRNINRMPDSESWGVDPDPGLVLPVSDDDYLAMLRARREFEIIRESDQPFERCVGAAWIRENLLDEQLASAVEALQARVRDEGWPTIGTGDPALVAFGRDLSRATDRRQWLLEQLFQLDQRIEELHGLADAAGRVPLLPPDVDLVDGTITIRDKHGNVVGTFRLQSGDVTLALESLAVTPIEEDQ